MTPTGFGCPNITFLGIKHFVEHHVGSNNVMQQYNNWLKDIEELPGTIYLYNIEEKDECIVSPSYNCSLHQRK
jgi:hypothetical protein